MCPGVRLHIPFPSSNRRSSSHPLEVTTSLCTVHPQASCSSSCLTCSTESIPTSGHRRRRATQINTRLTSISTVCHSQHQRGGCLGLRAVLTLFRVQMLRRYQLSGDEWPTHAHYDFQSQRHHQLVHVGRSANLSQRRGDSRKENWTESSERKIFALIYDARFFSRYDLVPGCYVFHLRLWTVGLLTSGSQPMAYADASSRELTVSSQSQTTVYGIGFWGTPTTSIAWTLNSVAQTSLTTSGTQSSAITIIPSNTNTFVFTPVGAPAPYGPTYTIVLTPTSQLTNLVLYCDSSLTSLIGVSQSLSPAAFTVNQRTYTASVTANFDSCYISPTYTGSGIIAIEGTSLSPNPTFPASGQPSARLPIASPTTGPTTITISSSVHGQYTIAVTRTAYACTNINVDARWVDGTNAQALTPSPAFTTDGFIGAEYLSIPTSDSTHCSNIIPYTGPTLSTSVGFHVCMWGQSLTCKQKHVGSLWELWYRLSNSDRCCLVLFSFRVQ